jgi:type III secretion protein J
MKKIAWLMGLALLLTGCRQKELQTGLAEQEAQEIIVLLKESGIEASREVMPGDSETPAWKVSVNGGDQDYFLALKILQERGLPRERAKGLEDVFSKSGLIPTAGEEKARLIVGLSGEMTRTLKSVAGVVDARVHVVLPENSPLVDKSQWNLTTSSVLLKYQGDQVPLREDEVRNLVARGIEGLQPENVAVVFKKVETKPVPSRNRPWQLGSHGVVLASLGLLALTTVGSLLLLVRGRQQQSKIQSLTRQIQSLTTHTAAGIEARGKS